MRHLAAATAAVSLLLLAGCGSDAAAPATTAAASETTAAVEDEPATTNAPATPADVVNGTAEITVTVGTDDFDTTGGTRVVSVPKGTTVNVHLTDNAQDEEYHLHVVDVETAAKKGETGTISFVADTPGQYDLESHNTEATLLVILVTE
jgi:glucose/arabinose dehydrogenase